MCVRSGIETVWTGLERCWRAGCRSTLLLGRAERRSITCLEELRLLKEEVASSELRGLAHPRLLMMLCSSRRLCRILLVGLVD